MAEFKRAVAEGGIFRDARMMQARMLILAGLSVCTFAACQPDGREAAPPPTPEKPKLAPLQLDLSTPERALESYWARKAWYGELAAEAFKEADSKLPSAQAVYGPISTGDALQYWTGFRDYPHAKLERRIESVRRESEAHAFALVRIRNVTPIPEGAKGSPAAVKRRNAGVMYRYELRKEGADWKVAQVWRQNESTGWEKELDRRVHAPSYPSEVYGD